MGRAGLRSAARGDLIVPGQDTGQSGVQGLLLWLVQNVGTNCRLETFARRLKTHLFRVGFSD